MPENNNVDILIQQKMEEFRLEPSPADWQAIYDRLHPRKNRRFFWWWFPLAAGLLFGGYWYATQNWSPSPTTKNLPITRSATEPATTSAVESEPKLTTASTNPGTPNTNQNDAKHQPAHVPSQHGITENKKTDPAATVRTKRSARHTSNQANNTTNDIPSPALPSASNNNTTPGISGVPKSSIVTEEAQNQSSPVQPIPAEPIQEEPSKNPATDTLASHPKDPLPPSDKPAVNKTSIPNLTDHSAKGWYLGAYAELGVNKPTEPVSMTKSADLSSSPIGSSSTVTYEGSGNNGLHWSAGLALERKMKKMSFSLGLGIQHNAWSSSGVTYKDSIVNNSYYNRTLISNNSTSYSHTAIEIPLFVNFRIAGKKSSSFWITTGLNNAITLKLKQNTDVSMTQNSANFSLDNSLTSRASTYQPQFRLGLTYENTQKKYHWQLSPFMQYGLNNMVKSGNPDIHMLHFGLQTRYFFKRLK